MKKIIPLLLLVGFCFASCTSEDSDPVTTTPEEEVPQEPVQATAEISKVLYINNTSTRLLGKIEGTLLEGTAFGLCYGTSSAPTIENDTLATPQFYEADKYRAALTNISLGQIYYIRPYFILDNTVTYGPETVFEPLNPVVIETARNFRYYATFQTEVNFNPEIFGDGTVTFTGADYIIQNYTISPDNTSVRVYNLYKSFNSPPTLLGTGSVQAVITYNYPIAAEGEILQSLSNSYEYETPVGETGEGGGIIVFDKGSYSDGWRYLERFLYVINADTEM